MNPFARATAGAVAAGPGYAGADRRGIVARLANRRAAISALWLTACVVTLPFAGVAVLMHIPGHPATAASVGAMDTAVIAFVVTAVTLLFRWRVVGDTISVLLAAVAVIGGLLFVPAAQIDGINSGVSAAVRAGAVALMLSAAVSCLVVPEIWAGIRPTRLVAMTTTAALAIAVVLVLTPVAATMRIGIAGREVAYGLECAACAAVSAALVVAGIRRRHLLLVGASAALLSIAANRLAHLEVDATTGVWTVLPSLLLLVGAVGFLFVTAVDLRLAFDVVVNHDVRGRRRWEAAESELARARHVYRGRAHDISGILSAVDGSLFVLGGNGPSLQGRQREQLVAAVRDQMQHLRSLLTGDGDVARTYDVGEVIRSIVAVHTCGGAAIDVMVEPALAVHGHPERVARIVNNLLANAAAHAPGAHVGVAAAREQTACGDVIAITVADDGPGLPGCDLAHALERGWRGREAGASRGAGLGLGLAQCRTLAASEGGDISLAATSDVADPAHRGLSARVRIPLRCPPDGAAPLPNFADVPGAAR